MQTSRVEKELTAIQCACMEKSWGSFRKRWVQSGHVGELTQHPSNHWEVLGLCLGAMEWGIAGFGAKK